MVEVSNSVNLRNTNVKFKGERRTTQNNVPYYHSDTAERISGVVGGSLACIMLGNLGNRMPTQEEIAKKIAEESKDTVFYKRCGYANTEEYVKDYFAHKQKMKKWAIPAAMLACTLTIGCGVLVDKIRNNKAKEVAEQINSNGIANASQDHRIDISDNNHPYYHSNVGTKYGALLGAGCGLLGLPLLFSKYKIAPLMVATGTVVSAIGGWGLGKIADHFTNKNAQKNT